MVNIGNDWNEILKDEFSKEYYLKLRAFLKSEYKSHCIHPDMYDIFNALKWTSYANTKIVILGQDPYHEVGQAHGLAFSVQKGVKIPPSLLNIYKELHNELGLYIPNNGYLEKWARQGVLLLNWAFTSSDIALLGILVRNRSLTASITAEYFVSIAGDMAFWIIPFITAVWLRPLWKSPAVKAFLSLANAMVLSPSHSFSPFTKW